MCDILHTMTGALETIEDEHLFSNPIHNTELYGIAEPSLLNLPVEVFLKICSFLDAEFISTILSKVCKRFQDILDDNRLWRYWVNRRIKNTYPALPHLAVWDENEVNWEEACIEIDKEYKKWTNVDKRMVHIVLKDIHIASIDSVLLLNSGKVCVSGGRDRGLVLWDVSTIKPLDAVAHTYTRVNVQPVKICTDAHAGWVWDLAADSEDHATTVYSASWDNTVKSWDLNTDLTCSQTFQCGMSALSVVTSGDLVVTGLFSKKVLMFDIRAGPNPVSSYKAHKGPVLALDTFGDKIASISEDKTLAVWDRRAGKILASDLKLSNERAYPVCISWSPAALYIGDSKGSLHLVDPEQFEYRGTHELWPEPEVSQPASKIIGIHQGLGSMIVCSDRGNIKYLYNSFPPEEYMRVESSTRDVTKLQYQNDIMVIGTCDSALEFWIPVEQFYDDVL